MQPKFDREYALQIPPTGDFNKYVDTALDNDEISLDEWYEITIYILRNYTLRQIIHAHNQEMAAMSSLFLYPLVHS